MFLKYPWKHKKLPIARARVNRENDAGGTTVPCFKLYTIVIKTVWYWHKNRPVDRWNGIENSALSQTGHLYQPPQGSGDVTEEVMERT